MSKDGETDNIYASEEGEQIVKEKSEGFKEYVQRDGRGREGAGKWGQVRKSRGMGCNKAEIRQQNV